MLQIIGHKGDRNTRAAERWAREHRVEYQFVDIRERKLSKRELDGVFASLPDPLDAIDTEGAYYRKNGYAWREFDPREEAEEHNELLKLPVLRSGGKAVIGLDTEFLKAVTP